VSSGRPTLGWPVGRPSVGRPSGVFGVFHYYQLVRLFVNIVRLIVEFIKAKRLGDFISVVLNDSFIEMRFDLGTKGVQRRVSKGVEDGRRPPKTTRPALPCTLFCRNVLTELDRKYGKTKK
jgi:hypothetical protein